MKIGIITYPLNNNYGNLLQAYALMTFLNKSGYDVELIDKRVTKISTFNKLLKFIKTIAVLLFKDLLYEKYSHYYTNMGFYSFIRKYITPKTNLIYNKSQLIDIIRKNKYATIIVGSDQIWRKDYIKNNIPLYFLSFVPDDINKISYSASFGVDYWQFNNVETERIKAYLARFKGVSVREDSAVELLKENVCIDSKHIVDPTLLLDIDDYLNISFKIKSKIEQNYLFCYLLEDDVEKIVDKVLDILNLTSRIDFSLTDMKKNNAQILNDNPVESWLYHLYHSAFVITDSFHGVVFSILFNKQFIVIPNKKRGLTRFTSILKMFNLEDRMIGEFTCVEKVVKSDMDWKTVNSILTEKREEAEYFILNSIESL